MNTLRHWMSLLCACATLAAGTAGAGMPGRGGGLSAADKVDYAEKRQQRELARRLVREIFDTVPLVREVPGEIDFGSNGVPELLSHLHGDASFLTSHAKPVSLQNGTLYYVKNESGGQQAVYFYVDGAPLAERLQKYKEQLTARMAAEKDNAAWFQKKIDRANSVRSGAGFDGLQWIEDRLNLLQGVAGLSPQQSTAFGELFSKRQKIAEDIAKLVVARGSTANKSDDDKIWALFAQLETSLDALGKDGKFFSKVQRENLGYDNTFNPFANQPNPFEKIGQISGGACVGYGDFAKSEAAWRKKMDALKKDAKLRFTSKAPEGSGGNSTEVIHTDTGLLYAFIDTQKGQRNIIVAFEPKTWPEQQAELLKDYKAMPEQKRSAMKPEERCYYDLAEKAASQRMLMLGHYVERYRAKGGAVTTEMTERLQAMVQAGEAAAAEALKALRAAAEKPQDAQLRNNLLSALVKATRTDRRNYTLAAPVTYDPAGYFRNLPWLLTHEQCDLYYEPSSAYSSITDTVFINDRPISKTMKVEGRPQAGKQYVSLDADNFPLESACWHIEDTLLNFFHQRYFRLKIDPTVYERGIRGLVEGTTVEELMKSLALRSGTKAVQDERNPNTWFLKP